MRADQLHSDADGTGMRARWPLAVLVLVLLVGLGAGAWWYLRGPDLQGVWIGRLDTLQIELHLADDGTFDWYLLAPGDVAPRAGGRPRASQWRGTWHMSEGELELRYEAKPPRKEGGVRYAQYVEGTLRTTFGLGGERATLRRQAR